VYAISLSQFLITGIVTIFFSGISARRYIVPNISESTKSNAETVFKTAASISETCIFLELGLSVFGLPADSFNWAFIAWAFGASLIGRAFGIYPIVFAYNLTLKESVTIVDPMPLTAEHVLTLPVIIDGSAADSTSAHVSCDSSSCSSATGSLASSSSRGRVFNRRRRKRKTPPKRKDKQISAPMAHVMWFAGLRGAVAYACVRKFPNLYGNADIFCSSCMVIVVVSLVLMGGATESLLRALDIPMNVDETEYMKDWHAKRALTGWFHDLEYKYLYRSVVSGDDPTIAGNDDRYFDYRCSGDGGGCMGHSPPLALLKDLSLSDSPRSPLPETP